MTNHHLQQQYEKALNLLTMTYKQTAAMFLETQEHSTSK